MHDEDNELGLEVSNEAGENWRAYGDRKLFDHENEKNMQQCLLALNISVDEVYKAWSTRTLVEVESFGAWKYAPTLASAQSCRNHPPMYDKDGNKRD